MPVIELPINIHAPETDTRSELLKAKGRAISGKVNACPFGCSFQQLDDHGYCRHLIGFSNDKKTFEPMIRDPITGKRVVRCKSRVTKEIAEWDDDGKPVMMPISHPVLDHVLPGDALVRISISYRVYRDVGKTGQTPELKADYKEPTPEERDEMIRQQVSAPPVRPLTAKPDNDFAVVQ